MVFACRAQRSMIAGGRSGLARIVRRGFEIQCGSYYRMHARAVTHGERLSISAAAVRFRTTDIPRQIQKPPKTHLIVAPSQSLLCLRAMDAPIRQLA